MKIILEIPKELALKLNKDYKVSFGENGISATGKNNGRRKYYLTESKRNMQLLKNIR